MKTKFYFGAFAALALGFASCSSDEPLQGNPDNPGEQIAEYDQTRYMLVSLTSPRDRDGRADFENGTTNENAVNRLDFLFYDLDGNPTAQPQTFTSADLKDADFTDNATGSNVARIWTSVVPVQVEQGKALPSQVICLVNASESRATELKAKTLSELISVTNGSFYNTVTDPNDATKKVDYFTMTNSVYYGTNVLTGATNDRLCATPINISQLFESSTKANEALTAAKAEGATDAQKALLVDIYVERLAAKVGLTLVDSTIEDFTLADGDAGTGNVTIKFYPQYWFMNAVNKTMYSTKRFGVPEPGDGTGITMDPGYDAVNTNFATSGMSSSWNAPTLHRSYWGCSPSYAANSFPMVSDQVNDLEGHTTDYNQNYYTYNQVKGFAADNTVVGKKAIAYNNGFVISNTGATATGYIYTTETTTAIKRIKDVANGNPAATVGSAVIVGHYRTTTGTEPTGEYPTFWIDTNNGENGTFYANEANAKNALAARNSFIFSDNKGTSAVTTGASFVLEHPKKVVRDILTDNNNIAGRLVTIQLASAPTGANTMYYYNGTSYEPITETNLAKANAQLAAVGYLDMYKNGRAFFNIPVRHLGWPANNMVGTDKLYDNGVYDWAKMRVGDLGVVRNHVYTINVGKIGGLGSGLRDDDQPIVPPVHAFKQYVAVRLNILAWKIVPAQNVDL